MPEEGNLLRALVQLLQPQVVVEFGFQTGASTKYLLECINDGWVYTYDPFITPPDWTYDSNLRLTFHRKGQQDIEPQDTNFKKVDLVFFDGSHDFKINVATMDRLDTMLAPDAIIAVHDTGCWRTDLFDSPGFGKLVAPNLRMHQPHEVAFCDYLQKKGWNRINMTPTHIVRHGLSLLQRNNNENGL